MHNAVQTLDRATDAVVSYYTNSARIKPIICVTILGAFLICLYIVLKEVLSTKIYTVKDAALYGILDIIGVIP